MVSELRRALRSVGFLLSVLPTGIGALVAFPLTLLSGVTILLGLGMLLVPVGAEALHRWTEWERRRAGGHLGVEVRSTVAERGFRNVVGSPATWRRLAWLVMHMLAGTVFGLVGLAALVGVPATVAAMVLWPVIPDMTLLGVPPTNWISAVAFGSGQLVVAVSALLWGAPALARVHARTTLRMLSPTTAEVLAERVDELAATRTGALEAHGAELRRIERDLHDGAQAQLVALAMRLGVAEKLARDDPETVVRLLREARDGAEEAMTGLRDVVRTLYPPILADRGLAGAVSALGARCEVPTMVTVGDLGEVPAAVEAAAYFVVAEALTNVTKHSAGTRALATVSRDGGALHVEVTDDGVGGVDESRGTGVTGMRNRVAALDGSTSLRSPEGGPTTIKVSLPCGP